MNHTLNPLVIALYKQCELEISDFTTEPESKEYAACQFTLNGSKVISRDAKITPKKQGQFVTFWKRKGNGPIEPYHETDTVDFFIVNVQAENKWGQFVFPKSILLQKGIISTAKKEGKRGFRVYPIWDVVTSKQAQQTQKWQVNYFYEISQNTDVKKVIELYEANISEQRK